MSKAAQLLKSIQDVPAKKKTSDVVEVSGVLVDVPTFGRRAKVEAVARLYRIANAKLKSMETEVDALKAVLRDVGNSELSSNAEAGHYVASVSVGGVKVSRANKFKHIQCERDALMEAVGATEYRIFFDESAAIRFDSIDQERQHINMCNEAGISVAGSVEERVSGNSKLPEFIIKSKPSLDADRLALLNQFAQDQAPRVGGR